MRRKILLGALALALALPAFGQSATCQTGGNTPLMAFAKETVTVSTTALQLTPATYLGAIAATLSLGTDTVNWWATGAAPTSSDGNPFAVGGFLTLCSIQDIQHFRVIRSGSVDAKLFVTYYKPAQ